MTDLVRSGDHAENLATESVDELWAELAQAGNVTIQKPFMTKPGRVEAVCRIPQGGGSVTVRSADWPTVTLAMQDLAARVRRGGREG